MEADYDLLAALDESDDSYYRRLESLSVSNPMPTKTITVLPTVQEEVIPTLRKKLPLIRRSSPVVTNNDINLFVEDLEDFFEEEVEDYTEEFVEEERDELYDLETESLAERLRADQAEAKLERLKHERAISDLEDEYSTLDTKVRSKKLRGLLNYPGMVEETIIARDKLKTKTSTSTSLYKDKFKGKINSKKYLSMLQSGTPMKYRSEDAFNPLKNKK